MTAITHNPSGQSLLLQSIVGISENDTETPEKEGQRCSECTILIHSLNPSLVFYSLTPFRA
jgi:hypothetical protein